MEEGRKWEELNKECLVKVLGRVGLESLILDVPFVCKSWYQASLDTECWKILHFPDRLSDYPSMWCSDRFTARFMQKYRLQKLSVTGFVKLVVSRSRRSAVSVVLPSHSTYETLELVSNECPALEALGVPYNLLKARGELIPELVSKLKDLQRLHLGSTRFYFKEILIQVSLHCKNFNGLSARGNFGNKEASAIATLIPSIEYLWLRSAKIPRESVQMILEGCKELVLLDAKNCI